MTLVRSPDYFTLLYDEAALVYGEAALESG
jgi:hypothetical protein